MDSSCYLRDFINEILGENQIGELLLFPYFLGGCIVIYLMNFLSVDFYMADSLMFSFFN